MFSTELIKTETYIIRTIYSMILSDTMSKNARIPMFEEILDYGNKETLMYRDILRWALLRWSKNNNLSELRIDEIGGSSGSNEIEAELEEMWKNKTIDGNFTHHETEEILKEIAKQIGKINLFIERLSEATFINTDIGNWLLEKHEPYLEKYSDSKAKTPKSTRLANNKNTIIKKLKELVYFKILEERGSVKSQKNDLPTTLYGFTDFGILTAFTNLVKSERATEKKLAKAVLVRYWFTKITSDCGYLSKTYFQFLDQFLRHIILLKSEYQEFEHLFLNLYYYHGLENRKIRSCLFKLYIRNQSARKILLHILDFIDLGTKIKMDRQGRELFLFQLKNDVESNLAEKEKTLPFDWEVTRYKHCYDYDLFVVCGTCSKCNKIQTLKYKFLEFLDLPAKEQNNEIVTLVDCPKCNEKASLGISPNCYF
jgi:hypothetical protein